MTAVLVTGASGFVGRQAVTALAERGFTVHAVARRRVAELPATLHGADLFDAKERRAVVEAVRPTHLLHLAWEARHGYFWEAPENLDWVSATLDLLRLFEAAGGQRAVFAGSCAEYDWTPAGLGDGLCREGKTPCRPATLYGLAKTTTNQLIEAYAARSGLSCAWGRVFFPYGPFEAPTRLVPGIIRALMSGRTARVANGAAERDFLHVRDAGAALAALLGSAVEGPVNIASGEATVIAEVGRRLARLLGGEDRLEIGSQPADAANPPRLLADVGRLRDEVGFEPAYDLSAGLADTVAWWRQRLAAEPMAAAEDS